MADEPEAERLEDVGDEEGGPVKSFLEHLEDLRWVLIKSLVALSVAVLLCLIAGDKVVKILKWPLSRAKISYSGTTKIVTVFFGTNKLGVFPISPGEEPAFNLGTNRFVAVRILPAVIGTNQMLSWQVETNGEYAETAKHLNIEF